jgi:hypothetical protein
MTGSPTMVEGKMGSRVIMNIRRWVLAPPVIALFIVSVVALVPVLAQPQPGQKIDKKVEKAQQFDLQAVVRTTEAAMAGQPATDFTMTYRNDFLKAQEGKTYVPFTVTFDQAQLPAGKSVTFFVRVVGKTAVPPPADAKKDSKDREKQGAHPEYVHQDASFITLTQPATATEPYKISRAFAVLPGEYDVYITLKERLQVDAKDREKTPTKAGVLKQTVTVPNFWTDDLVTSSVIVADKVEPLNQPLTHQEQVEQPYTFGLTQILPSSTNTFPKKGELSIVFLIYNTAQGADKKPDIAVEYAFYQKLATAENGEKFFNKTNPQIFNAGTLPPQFDPALGHQLVAGQSLPLGSFPPGEFRLEIKVTDKLSGKSITQNVKFIVTA